MKKKYKALLLFLFCIVLLVPFVKPIDIAILNPSGMIGLEQKNIMLTSTWLMLIIVIPVFILTFVISWVYRESNEKSKYTPNWDYSFLAEMIWWGIPCIIVVILSVIVWRSSHQLDPFKPIDTDKKPIVIQAVALQWKWLFIYPEQRIATVGYIQFPEKTPIKFEITADAPMNSFWIPRLGGQIYAMPGMKTKLYLIANEMGTFRGSSANFSGTGFVDMTFVVKATSEMDFNEWVQSIKGSSEKLNLTSYDQLAQPDQKVSKAFYILEDLDLHNQIIKKYMAPTSNMQKMRQ
jgi:cytochrome o ubiquinol oxidase subunit 2